MKRSRSVAQFARYLCLAALASCGQLECDQQKQKAIESMNAGIEAANSGSIEDGIKKLELALNLDPKNHNIAYNLGKLWLKKQTSRYGKLSDEDCLKQQECKNTWEKAAAAFETAAKNNTSEAMYFYSLGEAYYRAGNNQAGFTALQEAVKLNKKIFRAHWYIGRIHMAMDNPKEAATAWSEACRLNPSFGKPYIALGKLYMQWDFYAEAAKVLEQGALYAKAAEAEDRTNIFYELGMAYDALAASSTPPNVAMYDKAIDAYTKSLNEQGDNNDARFQLGFTYANKGDKANAKKYLEEFIKTAGSSDSKASQVYAANSRMLKLVLD